MIVKFLTLFLLVTTSLFAQSGPTVMTSKKNVQKSGGLFRDLDLTPDQKKSIESLKSDSVKMREFRREITSLETDLSLRLKDDATKDADLIALYEEIHEKRLSQMREGFLKLVKIRSILTPKQRVRFFEQREKRSTKRK